ncbi:MAG: hypothetical protein CMK33_07135 [Porticoccaceae bacterium]|nr:hypothetical protein [Porticoccaceae bacterium]
MKRPPRELLRRIEALEQAKAATWPEKVDRLCEAIEAGIAEGSICPTDGPILLAAVRTWRDL